MLSAQKEETRLQVAPPPNTPMPGGFGKVLNSIEGLQQRLDDFSLEDIGAATENAKTLTLRLSELERRLANLTEIKQSMGAIRRAVDEATHEISKLIRSEPLERPLHLQVIVQASNLIRLKTIRDLLHQAQQQQRPRSTCQKYLALLKNPRSFSSQAARKKLSQPLR